MDQPSRWQTYGPVSSSRSLQPTSPQTGESGFDCQLATDIWVSLVTSCETEAIHSSGFHPFCQPSELWANKGLYFKPVSLGEACYVVIDKGYSGTIEVAYNLYLLTFSLLWFFPKWCNDTEAAPLIWKSGTQMWLTAPPHIPSGIVFSWGESEARPKWSPRILPLQRYDILLHLFPWTKFSCQHGLRNFPQFWLFLPVFLIQCMFFLRNLPIISTLNIWILACPSK